MKLSIKSLVITAVILWGGGVFLCGVANTIWSGYAGVFLQMLDSPGVLVPLNGREGQPFPQRPHMIG